MAHITVLQQEAVTALNLTKASVVVDCTLGSGGHAEAILQQLGPKGFYIGIDIDESALEKNAELQKVSQAKVRLVKENFRNIAGILQAQNHPKVDAILADLGWRIEQFDGEAGEPRGFSFQKDEPLRMTYGAPSSYAFTSYDIVNEWREEDIANVIFAYGQERYSRKIAKNIVAVREKSPITTSLQLAEIVKNAVPSFYAKKKVHPATKTFQALRIAVNDEFDALRELLINGFESLTSRGRMAIITFHSLEDRIVKETFRTLTRDHKAVLVSKKPQVPTSEEILRNKRARSAKLRTIEKI